MDEGEAYVSPLRMEDQYFDAIERVEDEYGPYATQLSDLYLGLGQSLLNTGDYDKALDAFHRGVLVVRVNYGPNSPEQVNHLYLIANVLTLLGDEKEVEEVLRNIHFINWDHYGGNDPELLPALQRMHDWFLRARPPGSAIADYGDYRAMIQLAEEMASVSQTTRGGAHPETARAYRRVGEAQFQMARYMSENEMAAFLALGLNPMEATADVQAIARTHYDAGRRAFESYLEVLSADPANTPLDHARARAELGDWFLVFGRSRSARQYYEEAFAMLSRSDEYAQFADSYLGRPAPVYFFEPGPGVADNERSDSGDIPLDISMTITRSGDARDVEILHPPDNLSEDDVEAIERQVKEMIFRPALKAGEVVTTENFVWRYNYPATTAGSG